VDQATHDVVHAVVAEIEGEEAFERLVREAVTEAGYPLKGLVMDAAAPFLAAHANYFARVPLQLCRIHASRRLDFVIAGQAIPRCSAQSGDSCSVAVAAVRSEQTGRWR
jgi:transposase-like protein